MLYSHISKSDIDNNIKEAMSSKDIHKNNINIYNSDLSGYDFSDIKVLKNVSFMSCNLKGCNFSKMKLNNVHFGKSNIEGINLSGANVENISFDSAIANPEYWNSIITDNDSYFGGHTFFKIDKKFPVEDSTWYEPILLPLLNRMFPNNVPSGDFIGYKICGKYMVTLKIPKYTKRVRMPNGTIRVSRAEVLKIISLDNNEIYNSLSSISSDYDHSFKYIKGEIIKPNKYCSDRFISGPGIHLLDNKEDALLYHLYKQSSFFERKYEKQNLSIIGSDY